MSQYILKFTAYGILVSIKGYLNWSDQKQARVMDKIGKYLSRLNDEKLEK